MAFRPGPFRRRFFPPEVLSLEVVLSAAFRPLERNTKDFLGTGRLPYANCVDYRDGDTTPSPR